MLTLALILTLAGNQPQYGIDWTAGVVRVPAVKVGLLSGGWALRTPSSERLATMLWEVLRDVPISSGETVRDRVGSAETLGKILHRIPFHLRDGLVEIPLGGEAGLAARLTHAEAFLPALDPDGESTGVPPSEGESTRDGGTAAPQSVDEDIEAVLSGPVEIVKAPPTNVRLSWDEERLLGLREPEQAEAIEE